MGQLAVGNLREKVVEEICHRTSAARISCHLEAEHATRKAGSVDVVGVELLENRLSVEKFTTPILRS